VLSLLHTFKTPFSSGFDVMSCFLFVHFVGGGGIFVLLCWFFCLFVCFLLLLVNYDSSWDRQFSV